MRKACLSLSLAISSLCYSNTENIEVLIPAEELAVKIRETAAVINHDYQDKKLTVVMLMKGAICVTSDLIRYIEVPFTIEDIKTSSYGYNGTKAGELWIANLDRLDVEGRDVLIVDDIFETGKTLTGVMKVLEDKHPASIKTLILLLKDIPRTIEYRPDYVLFNIPDRFVIGYGLDYKELYRGLPDICAFVNDTPPF